MKSFPVLVLFVVVLALALLAAGGCNKAEQSQASKQQQDKAAAPSEKAEKEVNHKNEHGEDHVEHAEGEGALQLTAEEIRAAGIQIEAVQEQAVPDQISVTATIQANQDRLAHVSPRVSGRIVKVNVALGEKVKPGQSLAVLDSIELGEARSAFGQAQSEAALAQSNFERAAQLNEEEIIAQKDYLQARAEHEKAQGALRAAREKLRLLGATPQAAGNKGGGSVFPLVAPFAGSVIEKHAILGELGDPENSLFTIADLSTVWIEASVFERDLSRLRLGSEASVNVAAYPKEAFRGRVTYIGSVMDKETRTVRARIEVPNTDGRLKPEMFANAAINTADITKGLYVTEDAVTLIQGLPTIFIKDKDGFESRPVELGDKRAGKVSIRNGLTAGDLVVTSGTYALKARMLKSQMGAGHAH